LLEHNDIKTTLIYLHTSSKDLMKIISPLDELAWGWIVFALLTCSSAFWYKYFKRNDL